MRLVVLYIPRMFLGKSQDVKGLSYIHVGIVDLA